METDADDLEGVDVRPDGKVYAYGVYRTIHFHRPLADRAIIRRQRHITSRAERLARSRSGAGNYGAVADAGAMGASAMLIDPVPAKVRNQQSVFYLVSKNANLTYFF